MKNPPQNVSERYVNNLLRNGRNQTFKLVGVVDKQAVVDDVVVGDYFCTEVSDGTGNTNVAVGATPSQAVRRALEKFGVTFQ